MWLNAHSSAWFAFNCMRFESGHKCMSHVFMCLSHVWITRVSCNWMSHIYESCLDVRKSCHMWIVCQWRHDKERKKITRTYVWWHDSSLIELNANQAIECELNLNHAIKCELNPNHMKTWLVHMWHDTSLIQLNANHAIECELNRKHAMECHVVGSSKLQVFFAKEPYSRDYILQKRPIILRSRLKHAMECHISTSHDVMWVSRVTCESHSSLTQLNMKAAIECELTVHHADEREKSKAFVIWLWRWAIWGGYD